MNGPAKVPGTPSEPPDPGHSADDAEDVDADLPVLRSLKEQDQTRNRLIGIVAGIAAWQLARLVPGLGTSPAIGSVGQERRCDHE